MKNLLFLFAALGLAGCGGDSSADNPKLLVSNNFDTLDGWLPEPQNASISSQQAHSGKYSLKVDVGHDYSLTFSKPLAQLYATRPTKIKVSAWAFLPSNQSAATLVTTLSNPTATDGKPLLWEGIILDQTVKTFGKWVEVSKTITVPEGVSPASKLGFYLWRTGGSQPVYIDDLQATVEP